MHKLSIRTVWRHAVLTSIISSLVIAVGASGQPGSSGENASSNGRSQSAESSGSPPQSRGSRGAAPGTGQSPDRTQSAAPRSKSRPKRGASKSQRARRGKSQGSSRGKSRSAPRGNSSQGASRGTSRSAPRGNPPRSSKGKSRSAPRGNSQSAPRGNSQGKSRSAPRGNSQRSSKGKSQSAPRGKSQDAPRGNSQGKSQSAPRGNPPVLAQLPAPGNPPFQSSGMAKMSICHATGSATNPFNLIAVALPSVQAHGKHGDIIPAPDAGCPTGTRGGQPPQGPPGKITICHATSSATNPFVEITISTAGLAGHGGHAHDIVPAPAEGCPTGAVGRPGPTPPGKITICHATGSQTNPFVIITVSTSAIPAHTGHGDIIPAPASGICTAGNGVTPPPGGVTPSGPGAGGPAPSGQVPGGGAPTATRGGPEPQPGPGEPTSVEGERTEGGGQPADGVSPGPQVRGVRAAGAEQRQAGGTVVAGERAQGQLPVTGFGLVSTIGIALTLLAISAGIRRLSTGRH